MRLKQTSPYFLFLIIGSFFFYWYWLKRPQPNSAEAVVEQIKTQPERTDNQSVQPAGAEDQTPRIDAIAKQPKTVPAAKVEDTGLRLKARLNLALGSGVGSILARIGPTKIDFADEAAWLEDEGSTAATDYLELATVSQWLDAPIDSSGLVGPVAVPQAESYRLLAWETDGTLYFQEFQPMDHTSLRGEVDAGRLERFEATGVLVDLPKELREQGYAVLVQRLADDIHHPLKYALHLAFPEIGNAFDGTPLSLDESLRLAPLFPDASVRLTILDGAGRRGVATDVALKAGSLVRWRPSGDALPASQAGRILQGRIVWDANEPLPEGLQLQRMGRDFATIDVAVDGHFKAGAVSSTRPTQFRLEGLEVTETGRPLTPDSPVFVYEPDDSDGQQVDVEWEIPLFRWLYLGLSEREHERLRHQAPRGFPVFMLEQANDQGAWQNLGSDVFLQEPNGLAVSVTQPGRYRVVVALSPLFEAISDDVVFQMSDHEVAVGLPEMPNQIGYQLVCVSEQTGEALADTPVQIVGPSIGLPPMRVMTNRQGLLDLGPINVASFFVSVGDTEREVVVRDQQGTQIRVPF